MVVSSELNLFLYVTVIYNVCGTKEKQVSNLTGNCGQLDLKM